ncbi:MAG: deoxyribose-phosphate aldolase [Pseudomonadota bacterium]
MSDLKDAAARALACLDLTNLDDDCSAADIRELCQRASTPHGPVAAVCIWPRFVAQARELLGVAGVRIATVVNFPGGEEPVADMVAGIEAAIGDGADEIDMVVPYRALMEGEAGDVHSRVARAKAAAAGKQVKAILETGVLQSPELIHQASELAIDAGADFIKTSTGKVAVNATLDAARTMLEVIAQGDHRVGLKPAGGIRSTAQAAEYLALCDEVMGEGWATPETFRIGASGLRDALIATLEDRDVVEQDQAY